MMNAPCARLTMFSTPHTRASPRAITAYRPPSRMPLTTTWASSCTRAPRRRRRSAARPGRHRVLRLGREALRAEHLHELVVLHLDHDLGQVDLAVRVERDRAVEAAELH